MDTAPRLALPGYSHFGGHHWETAAMRNTLAYAGVAAPHTGAPFSEPMCLGIAGGIGVGYSFCPSVPGWGAGTGLSVVGRYRVTTTSADYQDGFFSRLGIKTDVKETSGEKGAYKNLREALSAGKPAIVWSAPLPFTCLGGAGTGGMYIMVVHAIDEAKGIALIADRAPDSIPLPLAALAALRAKVCSHKNRSLTFDAPKKISAATLKAAILSGIKACVDEFAAPKIKTYGLPGLEEWANVIDNPKNKKGWPGLYPGGKIYAALRDTYHSIETSGTGGSLFRPMYADFLDEAADVTKNKALKAAANEYRALGRQWSELADAALSSKTPAFKQTKELLKKVSALLTDKGTAAFPALEKAREELRKIEADMIAHPPLDAAGSARILEDLKARLRALHAAEIKAYKGLAAAIA
jgi:hypothetical protein